MKQNSGISDSKWILVCILIVCAIFFAYHQIGTFDFINYDDNKYVDGNVHVRRGLDVENLLWAFSFNKEALVFYWHPVTWLSYMTDAQFFGLDAGIQHRVNLIFHILNSTLLFLLFFRMTGAIWKSALVALFFAVHPVNVESVAWISERKNVLSTLCWLMTMHAYTSYARHPDFKKYIPILVFFVLGLLSKPMLITLPFVFLLMDIWPLQRLHWHDFIPENHRAPNLFHKASAWRLVIEKFPLFLMSFLSIGISIFSVHFTGQIIPENVASLPLRVSNAIVIYIKYITKLLLPHDMAIFYPFPLHIPLWQIAGAAILLSIITLSVILFFKKAPYLSIGWFWYLGTLFPIIGIFQSGRWPEMADRWLYIPEIGFFVMLVWGGAALFNRSPHKRIAATAIAGIAVVILAMITQNQAAYWKNSKTLFQHTLDVTKNNHVAHFNLGSALAKEGDPEKAMDQYQKALAIYPDSPEIHNNMGTAMARTGNLDNATFHFRQALQLSPDYAEAHINLANTLIEKKDLDTAIKHYRRALAISPGHNSVGDRLEKLLAFKNQFETTIMQIEAQLATDPDNPELYYQIGNLYEKNARVDQAMEQFRKAAELKPEFWEALYRQALIHAGKKEYSKSIALFKQIASLRPDDASIFYNIACLYSLQDRKDDAVDWLEKAIDAGYNDISKILNDPDLENLRQTSFYKQLVKQAPAT